MKDWSQLTMTNLLSFFEYLKSKATGSQMSSQMTQLQPMVQLLSIAFSLLVFFFWSEQLDLQTLELTCKQWGGLYCPPLIPAGIRRNPGNSRNSNGMNFGPGACQTDQTILTEFRMEFKFRRNGSRNHPEGILPGMRWNGIIAC